jgi:uncharacterized protein (TIGR02246 family)
MKKNYCFVIVATMVLAACQPKTQIVDTSTSKAAVNVLMENYLTAWNAKDVNKLVTLITDDGMYCGTDPGEILDKKNIADAWKMAFADTAINNTFTVDKREIRMELDGNSAIVMEQHIANPYTPKIPWRLVCRAVKTADGWKIDFISWNLIPKNEDVEKLNKALL